MEHIFFNWFNRVQPKFKIINKHILLDIENAFMMNVELNIIVFNEKKILGNFKLKISYELK